MPHFRKPANDITSQLEINFGDLGRPGRGRGGPRGGRGGRGRGGFSGEAPRPVRGGRTDKVEFLVGMLVVVSYHQQVSTLKTSFFVCVAKGED